MRCSAQAADDEFVDGALAAARLGLDSPCTSFLPPGALFPSLTDSILAGETDPSALQRRDVVAAVNRGSHVMPSLWAIAN